MKNDHRVLGRTGAHELAPEDLEKVDGGKLTFATGICTGPPSNPDTFSDQ